MVLWIVMLDVILLNVVIVKSAMIRIVILGVILLNVIIVKSAMIQIVALGAILPSVIMPSFLMPSVVIVNGVGLCIIIVLSVVMFSGRSRPRTGDRRSDRR